ncbi:phage shock protein PspD [Serratia symbiotica]|nr:phage shock protein PspD [Serratia symbiotica]MBF1994076.1 phage shock protein D [Serratia symbiotica]MBQ0956648.1 phage shock protein D [Serratia symbiotica]QTP15708.1 phage shock protein D [Serratia symbiotica]CDS58354.1 putative peripheral inner membrane phage-shock protein [Serratia symbiotica]
MNKNSTVNIDKAGGFKPGSGAMLKTLSKVMLIALLNYGPAGAAHWLLKAVGRKPIRVVLALVLELLFHKGLSKVLGRDAKGN